MGPSEISKDFGPSYYETITGRGAQHDHREPPSQLVANDMLERGGDVGLPASPQTSLKDSEDTVVNKELDIDRFKSLNDDPQDPSLDKELRESCPHEDPPNLTLNTALLSEQALPTPIRRLSGDLRFPTDQGEHFTVEEALMSPTLHLGDTRDIPLTPRADDSYGVSPTRPGVRFLSSRHSSNRQEDGSAAASPHPAGRFSTDHRRASRDQRRQSRELTRQDDNADAFYDSRASTHREFRRRASTLSEYYARNPTVLPQLPYTLRHGWRRWKVIGIGIIMFIDMCLVPIILYYALTFGANIAEWIIFAVVATMWGGPTYWEFATRSWKLIKKENFYRPLGATSRWSFDMTQYVFIVVITAVTAFLSAGSAPHYPWIRILSLPAPSILLTFGGCMFVQTMWSISGRRAPFRVSSTSKGGKVTPGVYTIVEDVVAVNGNAGRPYREALEARYLASPHFRKLMRDLSLFWSIPALLLGTALFIIICMHNVKKEVAYGVGWAVPFVWATVWLAITLKWVHRALDTEHEEWELKKSRALEDKAATAPTPTPLGMT